VQFVEWQLKINVQDAVWCFIAAAITKKWTGNWATKPTASVST